MKSYIHILILLLISFAACESDNECLQIDGAIITQEYDIDEIDEISITVPGNMFVTQADEYKLEIRTHEDLFSYLEISEVAKILRINSDNCLDDIELFEIHLSVPQLRKIKWIGAGDVRTVNDIDWESLSIDLIGAGNFYFSGVVDDFYYTMQGAGNLNGFNLDTRLAEIRILGTGNVEISCSEMLTVSISGVGNVYYKGNPSTQFTVSGVGEIIQFD